jgi:transposase
MAHLHKKMKKGRPYYYIREIARVGGKPKVVNQIYLGSIERIMELAKGTEGQLHKLSTQEFGALWLANEIDRQVDLTSLVDSLLPKGENETGPSVGDYFLYAVFNRMVDACSKRALPEWYRSTAIQQIRPVEIDSLNSQRYWERWSRVAEKHLKKIATVFLERISRLEPAESDCFLFDTTNYYTYMASDTESELAVRGKNKEGKDWLRQIGVALLVSRNKQLPLFYREYEGNRHDSKVFQQILGEVLAAMKTTARGKRELTLVFDKGMNSEENIASIDALEGIHFITTYSSYFAEELIHVKPSQFHPVDTPKNRSLEQRGKEDDRLIAYRTEGEFWNRLRTVVVTYNPRTAAKQRYAFDRKLLNLQQTLLELRSKVQSQKSHWTNSSRVEKHYLETCEHLHLPADLYEFAVEKHKGRWNLVFRKNYYRIGRHIERFGKNIIVTNHMDWSTDQIVRASLDRYMVEQAFRQSKDDDQVNVSPIRHWTDSKIRCHIFTCIAALAYLRLIELRLERHGLHITAHTAMEAMHRLHSCLCWVAGREKPERVVEEPSELQAQILGAFGHEVVGGVLQKSAA